MPWDACLVEAYEGGSCRIALGSPAPGIVMSRVVGHADLPATRLYIARAQRELLTHRQIRVFHDWSEVTGYDSDARDAIRAFGKSNTDARVIARHLVRSRILSMAIETAGLVLRRDFQATSDRRVFERWLEDAIRELGGRR
jgi:hypothetical protein